MGGADRLPVAGEVVPFEEAVAIISGYCLGEEEFGWAMPPNGVGDKPIARTIGAFAYRTYDLIPAAPSSQLEPLDVLVADGLNAQMRSKDIAGVLAVAPEVSTAVAAIDKAGTCFWDLEVNDLMTEPEGSSAAWRLWRAWTILVGVDGVDVARAHKILHHKRPRVFPLVDNQTIGYLEPDIWGAIHTDLCSAGEAWSELEETIARRLVSHGGVALTRLRLHDILLWTRATGRVGTAREYGGRYV